MVLPRRARSLGRYPHDDVEKAVCVLLDGEPGHRCRGLQQGRSRSRFPAIGQGSAARDESRSRPAGTASANPAMWLDGKLHFGTGAHEQKAKNIEASPRCVLTTGTNSYRSGLDVVIEGTVARVSDNGVLARLAQMWRDKLDWVFHVGDGVFLDSESAGVALVFAVTPSKILAFTKAPYSQTRYLM